jgi:hypothetical protein
MAETAMLAIGLVEVLRWKRWGFYVVLVRLGITILVQLFVYNSLSQSLIAGYSNSSR